MSAQDAPTHWLKCAGCGESHPVSEMCAAVKAESDIRRLNDPFDATCPGCRHMTAYLKAEIHSGWFV